MSRDFTGDLISMGDPASGDLDLSATEGTMVAWIRPDSTSGTRTIICKRSDAGNGFGYHFRQSTILNLLIGNGASFDSVSSSAVMAANVWQHVAATKIGTGAGSLKLYINGAENGSGTSNNNIGNSGQAFVLGRTSDAAAEFFGGLMAEVAVWNIGLSPLEIAALAKGLSPRFIRATNLRGYWPLYGTASPERDYSGRGNHGTLTGTAAGSLNPPVMPFSMPSLAIDAGGAPTVFEDLAEVYLDLLAHEYETFDEVYLRLQASGIESLEKLDAATVPLLLTALGGECHSTWSGDNFGEGEANLRWNSNLETLRWSGDASLRWSEGEISVQQVAC